MAEFTNIKINDVQYDVKDANAARASALATKQDVISDLSAIRSGASKGATAIQQADLAAVATSGSYNDLSNKPTIPDVSGFVTTSAMTTALAGKQDTLTFDNTPTANSNNPVKSGGIKTYVDGKATITGITTSQDGTFTIALSDGNSYTVNLNHTHENMAKLVKCTEATLPQTMADDTIYVQVDNLTTPTVIEALHIFGLEFTGGGGGSTPSLPYDAEIEYLQTTGTQYIDTGIVSGTNIVAEIKAILTQTSSDVQTFLCARTGNNTSFSNLLSIKNVNTPYVQIGGGPSNVDSSADPTVLHTYRTGLQNNSLFFETDGTTEGTSKISGTTSDLSMYLFARHTDSGADRGIYSKLYYCKITKDGSLVRDFIPVRVGTTGYMYDKVSGELFGNSGGGTFILGNDKS